MKTTLTKILFTTLLLSTVILSAMQADHDDLWEVIKTNNIVKVEQDIANGANVNVQDKYGNTALMEAANGHLEIVKLLIATKKVDINQQDNNSETALMRAAFVGYPKIVELLLATNKVDISKQGKFGYTVLMVAAIRGHLKVVELLLATNKVEINKQSKFGYTALMFAAVRGHLKAVELLLAEEAEVDRQDNSGKTVLMLAAGREEKTINLEKRQKFTNIIGQLLVAEADPLVRAKDGTTALELNNETINEYMRKKTSGILKAEVASELSLELPDAIADLTSKFTYNSLPECEPVQ